MPNCLGPSYPVHSCVVLSYSKFFCWCTAVLCQAVLCQAVLCQAVLCQAVPCQAVLYQAVRAKLSVPSCPVPSCPVPSCPVPSYPVPSCPVPGCPGAVLSRCRVVRVPRIEGSSSSSSTYLLIVKPSNKFCQRSIVYFSQSCIHKSK